MSVILRVVPPRCGRRISCTAAVVELVALDRATVKYSTVQNWFPGTKDGQGGVYNFVTKRGRAERDAKISWTQVETGSAINLEVPECHFEGR